MERFGAAHPEYSQMMKDGRRNAEVSHAAEWMRNQICQSSGVWDEIEKDVLSYLKGEEASVCGIPSRWNRNAFGWNSNCAYRRYVDVMPQDGMQECFCERCQAAYDKNVPEKNYATDLIWRNTARVARAITAAGLDGYVCQMAYPPYRSVPKFELPRNICVEVAETGPWVVNNPEKFKKEIAEIRAWSEKTGRRVWTWTYPHKYPAPNDPAIPCIAPRAWVKYFQAAAPWIEGTFAESESDRAIYNFLNYYAFSRLCWDGEFDVEAMLDEFHRLMFGEGAAAMKAFFDLLEEKWTKEVVGTVVDTPLGPVAKKPGEYEMLTKVYGSGTLRKLKGRLDAAEKAAAGDEASQKRIAYARSEIFLPLAHRVVDYRKKIDVEAALARRTAHPPKNLLEDRYWSAWPQKSAFDDTDFVTPPNAIHAVSDNRKDPRCYICQGFEGERNKLLKPNTKYRVSFFLKLRNVVPTSKGGGVYFELTDGKRGGAIYPAGEKFTGDMDWSYHEYVTGTGPEIGANPLMCLRIAHAFGEAWYDDVVVEEIE